MKTAVQAMSEVAGPIERNHEVVAAASVSTRNRVPTLKTDTKLGNGGEKGIQDQEI